MKTKIIIAGGRDFDDYDYLIDSCDKVLNQYDNIELVGGGAEGADAMGKHYAELRQYNYKQFYADWDKYGKAAGPIRNKQMAEYGNVLIVFWDGKSRGSANMINQAKKFNHYIYIFNYQSPSNKKAV